MDPDQDRCLVGPDRGPKCKSANHKSKQKATSFTAKRPKAENLRKSENNSLTLLLLFPTELLY